MDNDDPSFPALHVGRFQSLLEDEFGEFRRHFSDEPLRIRQDLRSELIAWVAVFLPEAIPASFTAELLEFMRLTRQRPDFVKNCWYRVTFLDVALCCLTNDSSWLDMSRANLSHHFGPHRYAVLDALSLVVDRLNFSDVLLRQCAEQFVENGFGDGAVLLMISTRGAAHDKRKWLSNVSSLHERSWNRSNETFSALASGQSVPNTTFLGSFLQLQQYLTVRLACVPSRQYVQGILLDLPVDQPALGLEFDPDLSGLLYQRLSRHPLMQVRVGVTDWEKDGFGKWSVVR